MLLEILPFALYTSLLLVQALQSRSCVVPQTLRHPISFSISPLPSKLLCRKLPSTVGTTKIFILSQAAINLLCHTGKHLWIAPALPSDIIITNTPINTQQVKTKPNIMKSTSTYIQPFLTYTVCHYTFCINFLQLTSHNLLNLHNTNPNFISYNQ
jgi:hypothetical protein